jgi:hypothetical protein
MAGPEREDTNHRDIVSLKEHLTTLISNLDRRVEEQRIAQHEAIVRADGELNRRLEGMNEFRAQINSERASYVRQGDLDLRLGKMLAEIRPMQDDKQRQTGGLTVIGVVAAVLLSAASLAVTFFKG